MALYGSFPNAQIPFTGWSPTLGLGASNVSVTSGAAQFNGITQNDDRIVKPLRMPSGRVLRRLIRVLLGAAPGANATETRTRVKHQPGSPGGLQLVETVTLINRATTTNDDNQITALLDRVTAPPVYVPDISGAGGAGKLKYLGVG